MSQRDMAAALGISTANLNRWRRLAEVPEEQFEQALKSGVRNVDAIIMGAPVPARGRVERAKGLFMKMNTQEQAQFLAWVAQNTGKPAA